MGLASTPQSKLTREQKTGVVLLLVFGVLAIGLGFLQIRNTIYDPFVVRVTPTNQDIEALFANQEARLQQVDTDQDGLTDYDELMFYETSPYLPDTDSDGQQDKEEIDMGSDPSCPAGQTCAAEEAAPAYTTTTVISPLFGGVASGTTNLFLPSSPTSAVGGAAATGQIQTMTRAELEALIQNPAALRQVLLSSGQISKEQLDTISDQTLIEMAKDLFQKEISASATRTE